MELCRQAKEDLVQKLSTGRAALRRGQRFLGQVNEFQQFLIANWAISIGKTKTRLDGQVC